MPYTKTDWVDGTTPITAAELNRMDTAIEGLVTDLADDLFTGSVSQAGTFVGGTNGVNDWTPTKGGTGQYYVYFTGVTVFQYNVIVTCRPQNGSGRPAIGVLESTTTSYFLIKTYDLDGTLADAGFSFMMIRL